jgi:hypothetical protein
MPNKTTRSLYNFEQFEAVLRAIAHKIAIEAVTNPVGRIKITTDSKGKLDTVETGDCMIRFYASHISYTEGSWSKKITFSFDVERKLYSTSNHSTKISFFAEEGKEKQAAEKITQFIEKIMSDAGVQPIPRFTLADKAHK